MRIKLKKFGDVLISRPAGREAYLAMNAYLLRGIAKNQEIELDFKGVKVLAPSWADEVLTKIVKEYKNIKLINTENSSVQATLNTLQEYSSFQY